MQLKTKILAPWVLFSLVLIGGFLLLEFQMRTLREELTEHVAIHQQAVRIARELRYLSLDRLAMVLQHRPGQTEAVRRDLARSERHTERLICALERLILDDMHQPGIEGDDQGRSILAAYQLARRALPDLYDAWMQARDTGDDAMEPLQRLQLTQKFSVVRALLDDLSRYQEITKDLVIEQANVRVERAQGYFYGFLAAALAAVMGFSLYQSYTIARPLRHLSRAAQAVARGRTAHFEAHSSIDEIGALNAAIVTMVGRLQGYVERLAARQEEILGQMAEIAHIGGWELDLLTNKLTWTDEVYRIHEVDPDFTPCVDRGIDFYAPEARPLIRTAIDQAIRDGTPWDLELPFITARGRHIWVRALGKPIPDADGRVVRLNGAFQDITEQRETLDAIRQANTDLEAFSYSVSHDLRAPLRAIDGFIEMLLEDHVGRLDDEGRELFGVVQDNARKMGSLIDDILAFSRAGRLEMQWQEVDMNALLREVWTGLAEQRANHEVELESGELPLVWGDPRAIRQIWSNLLANAVKFSRDRHPGVIQVTAETLGDRVRFSVRDNGVGFNPRFADKLFVLFQRLHGMDEFDGTGVGLAIVKRFVQKHGGTVSATAELDAGATFTFTLPRPPVARTSAS